MDEVMLARNRRLGSESMKSSMDSTPSVAYAETDPPGSAPGAKSNIYDCPGSAVTHSRRTWPLCRLTVSKYITSK